MKSVEHIIVCYGDQLGYHHGAKYQILSAYERWYNRSNSKICVVTDSPKLFKGYPCRVLTLSKEKKSAWSLNGLQHFGIKLQGLKWAMETTDSDASLLLDTDMYWKSDPAPLVEKINEKTIIMYRNEGTIIGSRNQSHNRFEEGLQAKNFRLGSNQQYSLESKSEMWASNILGVLSDQVDLISGAFELFSSLEHHVAAHTVEQFSVSEISRISGIQKLEGKNYLSDWSSTGRKNYVTPILREFFARYGETDFDTHLANWNHIKIRRPFVTLLKQKIRKKLS